MKKFLLILLAAIAGGAVSALLFSFVLPLRERAVRYESVVNPGSDAVSEAHTLKTRETEESMVWFWNRARNPRMVIKTDALGVGVVLTSDGLIATTHTFEGIQKLFAASFDRRPFSIEVVAEASGNPAQTSEKQKFQSGKPLLFGSGKMSFMKAVSDELYEPHLKPIAFFPFEKIEVGQLLFAFDEAGVFTSHRVAEVIHRSAPDALVSSDDVSGSIVLDSAPKEGAILFDASGAFFGIAVADGTVMPAEFLSHFLRHYLKQGHWSPTTLGLHFVELSNFVALAKDVPTTGLLLTSKKGLPAVAAKSPAARAGLKEGDVLISFDGFRLDDKLPLELLLQRYPPGAEVEIGLIRDNKEEKTKVVLGGAQ